MIELTLKDKQQILNKMKLGYTYISTAEIPKKLDRYSYLKVQPTKSKNVCWCKTNNGKEVKASFCRYCGKNFTNAPMIYHPQIVKAYKKEAEELSISRWQINTISNKASLGNIFYVKAHPTEENSIVLFKINVLAKIGAKDAEEEIEFKVQTYIEIIPGKISRCYKIVKGEEISEDMFDALKLSSHLTKYGTDIIFDDSLGLIDFILKNKNFAKYTGFLDCFNLVDTTIPRTAFFLYYLYLYTEYPVVEFLVKMGYIKLLTDIFQKIVSGPNRDCIKNSVKELNKILNAESTRGSMAFTIPKYISDDLNEKDESLYMFSFWGDVYQLNPVSKENYYKILETDAYYQIKTYYNYNSIPNVMKFGYSLLEIVNYLEKQSKVIKETVPHILQLMTDYLNMCDLMEIEPDKFPSNIRSAHDNCQKAYRAKANEMTDRNIRRLADKAADFLPNTADYRESEYFITIPTSTSDIVQEAQHQHNCCGSYCSYVANHKTLLFFIRKKEDPEESLVTAEYKYGRLNQIFYKNNRPVHNQDILNIAEAFVTKLNNSREPIIHP